MRRWWFFLILMPILFALGLSFLLPTGLASLPNAASATYLNAALAFLALIGCVTVLVIANLRFRRQDSKN